MSEVLACQGCKKEIPSSRIETAGEIVNLGAVMRATGCESVIHNDTSVGWLCPTCTARIIPHIEAILDILGDEPDGTRPRGQFAYWNCLPHMLRRHRIAMANKSKETPP